MRASIQRELLFAHLSRNASNANHVHVRCVTVRIDRGISWTVKYVHFIASASDSAYDPVFVGAVAKLARALVGTWGTGETKGSADDLGSVDVPCPLVVALSCVADWSTVKENLASIIGSCGSSQGNASWIKCTCGTYNGCLFSLWNQYNWPIMILDFSFVWPLTKFFSPVGQATSLQVLDSFRGSILVDEHATPPFKGSDIFPLQNNI